MGVKNITYLIREANEVITKRTLMNRAQSRINNMVSKITFFKLLVIDTISRGLPHLWDGNEDLYRKGDYQEIMNDKRNK